MENSLMATILLYFFGAASVVAFCGIYLTRYADVIGQKTRLGRTLAGIILLATATSLPELAVDCNLAYSGQADLVMGDLLGSSLMNLLILAILDLIHRGPTHILTGRAAAHALSATMSIVMTGICLLFLITPFRFTLAGVGPGSLLLAATYLLGLRLVYYDQQYGMKKATAGDEAPDDSKVPLKHAVIGYAVSAIGILLAAPVLASSAEDLATASGLGGTFIGTTLVAISTSMPEMVTTLAAVRSGAFDLAVGNILGSNTFNMLILLPADLFYDGSLLTSASATHAVTAVCVILATSFVTLGLLYRPEHRYWFIEPDAALVITVILAAFGLVYYLR
jgi:cation:H+ antiporter